MRSALDCCLLRSALDCCLLRSALDCCLLRSALDCCLLGGAGVAPVFPLLARSPALRPPALATPILLPGGFNPPPPFGGGIELIFEVFSFCKVSSWFPVLQLLLCSSSLAPNIWHEQDSLYQSTEMLTPSLCGFITVTKGLLSLCFSGFLSVLDVV